MNAPDSAQWMAYALSDLKAGQTLLDDPEHFPRQVCYFAQQSAEKSLKAIFVFLEKKFPFTHDLDRLRDLLPNGWNVKNNYPELADLTIWAIEPRYPGDMPDVVEADARQALQMAEGIYQLVEEDIADYLKSHQQGLT
ncbi:MAG: HEPN domain-containing protein [Anaerolineae bacterium]|nr:HEPN domain-containing protein [Anaerolineae bacterium]